MTGNEATGNRNGFLVERDDNALSQNTARRNAFDGFLVFGDLNELTQNASKNNGGQGTDVLMRAFADDTATCLRK